MANEASEIVVGANGSVSVAPVGTTLPATVDTALDAAFIDLGFVTEDGATFTDEKTVEPIPAWQSFYAVRRIVTARNAMVSFSLLQWNTESLQLAFGGGTVTEPTNDFFTYTPPDPEDLDERALVLKWEDGLRHYALLIPRGMVTDNVETQLVRTGPAVLPITFGITADGTTDPWTFLSNDDDAFVLGS